MRKSITFYALTLVVLFGPLSVGISRGQTAPKPAAESGISASHALGEVSTLDAAQKQFTLKTAAGDIVVHLSENTKYLRVQPGEKTLEKAETIALGDIGIGDRVMARGKVADDKKSVTARQVIVMSKAAIAQKQERDREEWNRRGIAGTISAIDPAAKEITLSMRTREGKKPIVISPDDKAVFRRYAPDSVKFTDAKPSSFSELKVGDQMRALGDKSADNTRFKPEIIVSGSFMMAGGFIKSINGAGGEITIDDIPTKKPLTVVVNKDTVLRRIPHDLAMTLAPRVQGAAGNTGSPRGKTTATAAGAGVVRKEAGGDRPQASGTDIQEMLDRLPAIAINDLQPGDAILVSSTVGADPSRVTAILLASGIEPLLIRPQQRQAGATTLAGASLGLPSGVLDAGVGLPPN
jgi:hypothetical protein